MEIIKEKRENKFSQQKQKISPIEIVILIAIILSLFSIVWFSIHSEKKRVGLASVQVLMTNVLPELIVCTNEGGEAISGMPVTGNQICCVDNLCASHYEGFTDTWPALPAGWKFEESTGSLANNDYVYQVTDGKNKIICQLTAKKCELIK